MPNHVTDSEIINKSILIPCIGELKHIKDKGDSIAHDLIYWMKEDGRNFCPMCEQIEKRQDTVKRIKTLGEKLEGPTER